ncbi:TRAP transporter substrate-binding protein [Microvirga antarctica]|uniref:TRAP transporter substrate-binding protein n=1 Tax=Microvirga antarctica TaxID=2819233 RepID=UPI001B3121D2|nr:TRAP transporter substrate-binding protein [Microvirga antarctica]
MERRTFLASAAALAAASTIPGNARAATRLRFAHFSVTDDPNHVTALSFADKLKNATGGEFDVTIIPNSQLGGEVDVVEGILLGTIDLAPPSCAVLANWVPEMNVLNMPFAFRDWDHYTRVLNGSLYDQIVTAAAAKNIRFLGFMTSGVRHIMTRQPVNSIADLKGRKIRTVQNPVHVATFNAFGANATAIAYNEVYSALQTGVVDGADAANTNYYTQKFYEVANNWAQIGWLYYSNGIIMSEAKFQRLPPERQKALMAVGREAGIEHLKLWADSDAKILDQLKAKGVNITNPDPAPFREQSKAIYDQFLKTDKEKQILADILAG